jgi:hypothetical protein
MSDATTSLPYGDCRNEHNECRKGVTKSTTKHLLAGFFDKELGRVG